MFNILDSVANEHFSGLEDFENKIDKIASGVDNDEGSWINQLYNQFSGRLEPTDDTFENVEGLEPPMLDETWGLKDGDEEQQPKRMKRNPIDEKFKNEIDCNIDIFN